MKRKVFIIIALCAFGYLAYVILHDIIIAFASFNEDLPNEYKLDSQDSTLFKDSFIYKINVDVVRKSKVRMPVTFISFDNKYNLLFYRIPIEKGFISKEIISEKTEDCDRTSGIVYVDLNANLFKMGYKTGVVNPIREVQLIHYPTTTVFTVQTDSSYFYSLSAKKIAVQYGVENAVDFFIESNGKTGDKGSLNCEAAFKLLKEEVIVFILLPKYYGIVEPPFLLKKILK